MTHLCSWCRKEPKANGSLYCGDLCRESAEMWAEREKMARVDSGEAETDE